MDKENFSKTNVSVLELLDLAGDDFNLQMQLISQRYQAEERLLKAIRQGAEEEAIQALTSYGELMRSEEQEASPTSEDPLRDFKNSVTTMNTLFRKAIETNYVHPIYIHRSSSYFGAAIENSTKQEELVGIIRQMVHVYCELVKQCSLAAYSPIVQKAILYMDIHLASPISTRDIAKDQFLSPNYLSTRFKEEMGLTISEYLIQRRIRLACQFLSASSLSIQEIAERTGIGDASYFSKQFKKILGMSPLQYKKQSKKQALP